MKIYISADIEGVTGTTDWNECELGHARYKVFQEQMTKEVNLQWKTEKLQDIFKL